MLCLCHERKESQFLEDHLTLCKRILDIIHRIGVETKISRETWNVILSQDSTQCCINVSGTSPSSEVTRLQHALADVAAVASRSPVKSTIALPARPNGVCVCLCCLLM